MGLWFAIPEEVRGALIIFLVGVVSTIGAYLRNWINYQTGLNKRNAKRADYFTKRLPQLEVELGAIQAQLWESAARGDRLQHRVMGLETANALLRQEISQLREKVDYYKGIETERDNLRKQLDAKTARVNELNMELSSMQQRVIDCEERLQVKQNKEKSDES